MPELPPILIVMALAAESDGVFEAARIPVLYCGVGKVNAAVALKCTMADLAGPKMRIGKLTQEPVELKSGDTFILTTDDTFTRGSVCRRS